MVYIGNFGAVTYGVYWETLRLSQMVNIGNFGAVTNVVYWETLRLSQMVYMGDFGAVTNGVYWKTLKLSQMVYIVRLWRCHKSCILGDFGGSLQPSLQQRVSLSVI